MVIDLNKILLAAFLLGFTPRAQAPTDRSPGPAKDAEPDQALNSRYCRVEYTADREQDAKKLASYADSSLDRMSRDLAPLDPRLMDHFDCAIVQYGIPKPGLATNAQATTDSENGGRSFRISILAQSSISPTSRTLVGEPKDEDYMQKTIADELSSVVLERITRHKGAGWYFHDAPQWFVQGIEGYFGIEYSSPHSRDITLPKYVTAVCSNAHEVSFTGGIHVGNPYVGGFVLTLFLYDVYGKERVNALLMSHRPSFEEAFLDLFGDIVSVESKYNSWNAKRCEGAVTPNPR